MNHHCGHSHDVSQISDVRLAWAIGLNLLLSVVEAIVGILSGSLSLIADAVHNFSDCLSLVVAMIARIVSRKTADKRRTFGYRRAEVLGAFVNLLLLSIMGLYLLYEAAVRFFFASTIVHGWPMIFTASIALIVDIATAVFLREMAKGSINLRAGFLHNIADALASIGVMMGGAVILLTEWYIVDLIITVGITGFILWQAWGLMKPTVAILMQSVPVGIETDAVAKDIASVDCVLELHHVHIWELDEGHRLLEAHVVIDPDDMQDMEKIKVAIKQRLRERHSIRHSTLEFEFAGVECAAPTHEDTHTMETDESPP